MKVSLAVAEKKFESCVREKRNKGYEEKTAAVKPAAIAPPQGQGSGSKAGGMQRALVGHKAPLLNPIDLTVGLAIAALAHRRQMLQTANPQPKLAEWVAGNGGLGALALLGFVAVNGIWVRTAHHFMDVPWDYTTLSSPTVLTGFSILWTLMAMGLMLYAQRKELRVPWLAGAGLLGVVVAKLLFVDMSQAEGIARIIAFIGVGVLMLLIGYFVPLPPRKGGAEEKS